MPTKQQLHDEKDRTLNEIEDINKQLGRRGFAPNGGYLYKSKPEYYRWRNQAITARTTKLEYLRSINAQLRDYTADDNSTRDFWYRHGNAAIELLKQVEQFAGLPQAPQIKTLLDQFESELITIGLQQTTNTAAALSS